MATHKKPLNEMTVLQLREELISFGEKPGPINDRNRSIFEKRIQNWREGKPPGSARKSTVLSKQEPKEAAETEAKELPVISRSPVVPSPAASSSATAGSTPAGPRPRRNRSNIRDMLIASASQTTSAQPATEQAQPASSASKTLVQATRVTRRSTVTRSTVAAPSGGSTSYSTITSRRSTIQASAATQQASTPKTTPVIQTSLSPQKTATPKSTSAQASRPAQPQPIIQGQPEALEGNRSELQSTPEVMEVDEPKQKSARKSPRKRKTGEPKKEEDDLLEAKRPKTSDSPAPTDEISSFAKFVEMTLREMNGEKRYKAQDDIYELLRKHR